MTSAREVIARAIEPGAWSILIVPIWPTWKMLKRRALAKADTVLALLRAEQMAVVPLDPTDAMIEAAAIAIENEPEDDPNFLPRGWPHDMRVIWHAMLKAGAGE